MERDTRKENRHLSSSFLCRTVLCLLAASLVGVTATAGERLRQESSGETQIILKDRQREMFDGYVELLRSYPRFESVEAANELPSWTDAPSGDPSLMKMSEQYGLKEIAGQRSEADRFVRLMEWAHRVTNGQGDIGRPDVLNAPAIIEFVRSTGHALDCRVKAIVLNEALLALGYHSRRISFQPARHDGDTHSVVIVFSRDHNKWVCLDPTFNTYFHDRNGELLGYLEIRDAYRSGRAPLFRSITVPVRGQLMLAGQPFDGYDSWYVVYMAKNCFKVSCPQRSAFGYESSDSPRSIALLPVGYESDSTGRTNTTFTTNARYFFGHPRDQE
jgi:hypothetical protein